MIVHPLSLPDVVLIDNEPFRDHRGIFARFFCSRELGPIMGERQIVNVNFSRTIWEGTVRGMHFQRPPHQEMKLIRCIRGAVFDVIVDIRRDSPTFLQWHGEALSADNMKMLCVPEGFAHGFQTLEDDCELLYFTTAFFAPESEGGIRYDDPAVGIRWPRVVTNVSQKDSTHPLLHDDSNPLEAP